MDTKRVVAAALAIAVFFIAPISSWAQRNSGWGIPNQRHKVEVTPYVGYTWTGSVDVRVEDQLGKMDIDSSPSWGIEIDVNVKSGGQFTLLYQRQDSELNFRPNSSAIKQTLGDVSVDYFQIGGIGGVQNGRVMPFGLFTLGATRLAPDFRPASDIWKFSLILGFGAKIYLTDRLGVRVQARLPWVLIDGGGAVACGGGGCYVALGGSGVVQPDLGVGLILMF
ncbi:MAG: hypothetical protein P8181_00965 [bacterium]